MIVPKWIGSMPMAVEVGSRGMASRIAALMSMSILQMRNMMLANTRKPKAVKI